MRHELLLAVCCLSLFACGGGGTSSTAVPAGDPLNPTLMTLEQPPTNGQLPAELLPPT